jgi:hypothetical protein
VSSEQEMKNRYRKPENTSFRARIFIDTATRATFFVEREALNKNSAIVYKGKIENLRMKISALS